MKRRLYILYHVVAVAKDKYYNRPEFENIVDAHYDYLERCISKIEHKYPQLKSNIASPSCYVDAPTEEVWQEINKRFLNAKENKKFFKNEIDLDEFYLEDTCTQT
jgi:NAD-dependent DNA ligase